MSEFKRERGGERLDFHGMDVVHPPDALPKGRFPFAQNCRAYLKGAVTGRATQDSSVMAMPSAVQSLRRLNDTTPAGPAGGYVLVGADSDGGLYIGTNAGSTVQVDSGLSGNPVSLIPFRPNTSVQPWMYVGDSVKMDKVRSDGTRYKMGIKEPQLSPVLGTGNTIIIDSGVLQATTLPWTINQATGFNFGQTNPSDGTTPFVINVLNAETVTLTVTGSATVNGGTHAPGDAGATSATYPGQFTQKPATGLIPDPATAIVIGAFLLADGLTIVPHAASPYTAPNPITIGASVTLHVPANATTLQIGINSAADSFNSNSGSFTVVATVTINGVANALSSIGPITAYYWGDTKHATSGVYFWKSPNDPGGSGPVRTISNAGAPGPGGVAQSPGFTTGNSFIIDATITGGVASLPGIGTILLPATWTTLRPDSSIAGSVDLFIPALEAEGYADWNSCIIATLFVPAPGAYRFTISHKDGAMWGIGGGATWTGKGTILGMAGQTETVVSQLPLLPITNTNDGDGYRGTSSVDVTFPSTGTYPIEIDWCFYDDAHPSRILLLTASPTPGAPVATIPPLSQNVRQDVQYRYVYRSSATGAQSNPSPESVAQAIPVLSNTVTSYFSTDPQVDVVDYYRIDLNVADFTYVATGPNDNLGVGGTNTAITDALLDTQLGTKLLEYDNFEPFPSIDLPRKGVVNVSGGVISWVSGDQFNLRWLGGTQILIGSPTSLAYTLIARPTSATSMAIPGVPDGTNLAYEIEEPILAAQPLPYMFGPTDNINFSFACGDPLRPGTLYWCKGSNLDAAPDTNQEDVTSPSEPLVNGAMSGGLGVVFSSERAWLIAPNFFNALATVTGTQGSTWSLQASAIDRGLYMPRCVCVEGAGKIFFRVKDGIHVSPGGQGSKSITDEDLYNLFPHEGFTPQPVTRGGFTVHPPDDSNPQAQKFGIANGYLYYDYEDISGTPRTLVFDIAAMGWVWDQYQHPATAHALEEGETVNGVLTGCQDGTVRPLTATGAETATSVLLMPCNNAGDTRSDKHWGDLFIEVQE